jgi:hypothetical protein
MESRRISKKLLGNLLGKLRIFFQNAPGILGETLGVFGEILVKVSLLKRASRSHAKTGFSSASISMVFTVVSSLYTKIRISNVPKT